MYLDALVIAEAVHNNGGIVMMQVQKMVKKATLHPKAVRIPGYLVDIVVVDPAQTQLYGGAPVNRFISGDFTLDAANASDPAQPAQGCRPPRTL